MRRTENISIMRPKRCEACGREIRHIAARYMATEPGEDLVRAYWHPACADAIDATRRPDAQATRGPAGLEESSSPGRKASG